MRLTSEEIKEITERWRNGEAYAEDVGCLLHSHESLLTDLKKVEGGNIRLWKENEELIRNLKMAVQLMLALCTDEQLNDVKELGNMAKETLERMGVER